MPQQQAHGIIKSSQDALKHELVLSFIPYDIESQVDGILE